MSARRLALLVGLTGSILCPIANATNITGPWIQAYQPPKGLAVTQAEQSYPAPNKCYSNTRKLLCAQLVQTLSASTIEKARQLADISVSALANNDVALPDGSSLTDDYAYPDAINNVDLYRVTYRSKDINGLATKLSGLVAIPRPLLGNQGAKDGMVVYMHATTADINNAPGDRSEEAYGAITAFAGNDWLVAMPDYLGYGVNKKPHPYAMGNFNAQSGIDMIRAARELAKKIGVPVGSAINVTGYSEGGGNAMWLGRALDEQFNCDGCQKEPDMKPTRIAPMSGPYDLSGATARSFIDSQPAYDAQNIQDKPTLLAFAGIATAKVSKPKIPVNSLLQETFASQAKGLFPGPYPDEDVGTRMLTVAIDELEYFPNILAGITYPDRLLQPSLVEAIKSRDFSNPAMRLWQDNDAVNWSPNVPLYLLGITQDPIVPFASSKYPLPAYYADTLKGAQAPYASGNSEQVIRAMRSKGKTTSEVSWLGFNGLVKGGLANTTTMTHAAGFVPCSMLAVHFFRGAPLASLPSLADPTN